MSSTKQKKKVQHGKAKDGSQGYRSYIRKIHRSFYQRGEKPLLMASSAVTTFEQMCHYFIDRIMEGANALRNARGSKTLSGKDILGSAQLSFRGSEASFMKEAMETAYERYVTYKNAGAASAKKTRIEAAIGGITFPVARVLKEMRKKSEGCSNVAMSAPIYMTAALDFLMSMTILSVRSDALNAKKKRITNTDIKLCVYKNKDLDSFFDHFVFTTGVVPHIHTSLLKPTRPLKAKKRPSKK